MYYWFILICRKLKMAAHHAIRGKFILISKKVIYLLIKPIRSPYRKFVASRRTLSAREAFMINAMAEFENFLLTTAKMTFGTPTDPQVTVLLILYNKAELTFQCLRSLTSFSQEQIPFQLLIIDNASSDKTRKLLDRIEGATVVYNKENVGFLNACNQAMETLKTPFVLFLNNDTVVQPGSLAAGLETLKESEEVGAVGGRIILPDGTLQEAGNILWNDGTCEGYGRGMSPLDGPYMYKRRVDYCSGAFLLTRTSLFKKCGGFDRLYLPYYYEETDFCVALGRLGYSVVFDPRVCLTHVEFGSTAVSENAFRQMDKNRLKFVEKNRDRLVLQPKPGTSRLQSRSCEKKQKRVLYIEDRVPFPYLGAGFPRSLSILQSLVDQGYFVTLFPSLSDDDSWGDIYSLLPREVEVARGWLNGRIRQFLLERKDYYDLVWVCRPHNMEALDNFCPDILRSRKFRLIYDAEAFFSDREKLEEKITGRPAYKISRKEHGELRLAAHADAIISVSEKEADRWSKGTGKPTYVVGHEIALTPTARPFEDRSDFLFVGSMHGIDSPNADSVLWFMERVFPLLSMKLGGGIRLRLVGYNKVESAPEFDPFRKHLDFVGKVEELSPFFDCARVMVVPTRYASGIPQKVFDGAAHGVPMVCTPLIASQMNWSDGKETLTGESAGEFADACVKLYQQGDLWLRVRERMLASMKEYKASHGFAKSLSEVFRVEMNEERL